MRAQNISKWLLKGDLATGIAWHSAPGGTASFSAGGAAVRAAGRAAVRAAIGGRKQPDFSKASVEGIEPKAQVGVGKSS